MAKPLSLMEQLKQVAAAPRTNKRPAPLFDDEQDDDIEIMNQLKQAEKRTAVVGQDNDDLDTTYVPQDADDSQFFGAKNARSTGDDADDLLKGAKQHAEARQAKANQPKKKVAFLESDDDEEEFKPKQKPAQQPAQTSKPPVDLDETVFVEGKVKTPIDSYQIDYDKISGIWLTYDQFSGQLIALEVSDINGNCLKRFGIIGMAGNVMFVKHFVAIRRGERIVGLTASTSTEALKITPHENNFHSKCTFMQDHKSYALNQNRQKGIGQPFEFDQNQKTLVFYHTYKNVELIIAQ